MLILARHAIGWNGKDLEGQLREAKAWEEGDKKMRMRRQDAEHVYDGCELDDAETRVKVVELNINYKDDSFIDHVAANRRHDIIRTMANRDILTTEN
jgi:hypothetical protein